MPYIYNKNTVFLEDRKLWCIAKKNVISRKRPPNCPDNRFSKFKKQYYEYIQYVMKNNMILMSNHVGKLNI